MGVLGWKNRDTGQFEVTRVFPDSPVGPAGLTKGMLVNKIDGARAETRPYAELVKMLREPAGTKVTVEMIDSNGATNVYELTRAAFFNRIPRTPEEQAKRDAQARANPP